jgi:hypothetical protein
MPLVNFAGKHPGVCIASQKLIAVLIIPIMAIMAVLPVASSAQPGIIENFTAVQKGDGAFLQWKIGKGNSCIDMSAQRHGGDGSFETYFTVEGLCGSDDTDSWYEWTDPGPFQAGREYTFRIWASNGTVVSEERAVIWRSISEKVVIAPNPVSDDIRLLLGDGVQWPLDISLFDRAGREISRWRFSTPAAVLEFPIAGTEPGLYLMRIRDAAGLIGTEGMQVVR